MSEPDATSDPERIASIYAEAVELAAHERSAFLTRVCAGDAKLQADVESLLAAHSQAGTFLEHSLADLRVELESSPADPLGQRIGSYRLLAEIGRGGMGVVYLAERSDGSFEQQVALKRILNAFVSGALLDRFLQERPTLARLEHPHIARLIDGGVSDDGRPYFAMELVRGAPLLDYCDSHQLSLNSRLELFEQACRAVQHAHAHLVVHRDLKPSNMLVGNDGNLKLLDFGIAKLLVDEPDGAAGAAGAGDAAGLTRVGAQPLTIDYAAPEQLAGQPATTATDVYSLGIVLGELVTGQRPIAGRAASLLDRDLAAIVHCALEPDPAERYGSAEALAEDLRRFSAGLPVRARRGSLGYRTRKLLFRHKLAFLAASAVTVALVGGLVASFWQARIAARERDAAESSMRRAEEVQAFLTGLFEGADPASSKGEDITARELLERGEARIAAELAGQPQAQVELLHTLARVNLSLGRYQQARQLAERELELARSLHGPRHTDVARALNLLGNAWLWLGDVSAAAACYREALGLRRELLGGGHRDVATSLNELAIALQEQANFEEAETVYREALAIYSALPEESTESATTLSNLGGLLQQKGDLTGAEAAKREALRVWRLQFDEEHPLITSGLGDLASLRFARGDLVEAESLYRQALAVERRVLGPDHPSVSTQLNNLSRVLLARSDAVGSEALLREVLAIDRKNLGIEHPYIAISLDNLVTSLTRQGRNHEALDLADQALAMHRKLLDADHPRIARSLRGRAEVLMGLGRWPAALATLDDALTILNHRLAGSAGSTGSAAAAPPNPEVAKITKLRDEVLTKLAPAGSRSAPPAPPAPTPPPANRTPLRN